MTGDRFALVTGGGSGIGRAAALALARAGWHVALAGRQREPLDRGRAARSTRSAGGRSRRAATSAIRRSVKRLFATIERGFGRLDLLFNNAGTGAPAVPIDELTFEQWKAVVDVNLNGAFLCAQGAFALMKRQNAAGRAHHQQRLDLRPCAAAELRALHRDQARDHRPDQVDRARRPRVRHRLRPDRHRQRADRDGAQA